VPLPRLVECGKERRVAMTPRPRLPPVPENPRLIARLGREADNIPIWLAVGVVALVEAAFLVYLFLGLR
jgi:hypothetical protein